MRFVIIRLLFLSINMFLMQFLENGLKINYELYKVFRNYLDNHIELGYRSVSEFLNEIIRDKAKEILQSEKKINILFIYDFLKKFFFF